jgi:hypothetical protein
MASKSKGKQTPPFKNPTITKPSKTQDKETVREGPLSNSVISHQGWRSTEDRVRSTAVLAKTTMEKLAAFRFKPASHPQTMQEPQPPPQPPPQLVHSEKAVANFPREPLQEITHPSSNHDLTSDDSFFNEALGAVNAHTKFNGIGEIKAESMAITKKCPTDTLLRRQPNAKTDMLTFAGDDSSRKLTDNHSYTAGYLTGALACDMESGQGGSCEDADYFDLPTSEAPPIADSRVTERDVGKVPQVVFNFKMPISDDPVAFQSQSKVVENIARQHASSVESPPPRVDEQLAARKFDQVPSLEVRGQTNRSSQTPEGDEFQNDEVRQITPVEHDAQPTCQDNGYDEPPKYNGPLIICRAFGGCNTDIQIERSEMDGPEETSKEVSSDMRGSDEFDQGLDDDDDDLLAIISDAVIPQTTEKAQPEQQKNLRVCGRFLLPSTRIAEESHVRSPLKTQNIINPNSSSPPVLDLDDEFPIDVADEVEMLKLGRLGAETKESHAPPGSVQRAFNALVDGEVCDSSLQFSPPKSQSSGISPLKLTRGGHTDKNRASQSPGNSDSLAMEEEDWSFIRSEAGTESAATAARSKPFCDPYPGARLAEPRQTVSSSPTRHSVAGHDGVQTPATQNTTDASWSLLDDSHEYEPMNPFARPDFPSPVLDRSPVVGLSAQSSLRACFRIGEMFNEGVRCNTLGQDAVIELFARVTFSSREAGSTKQHFKFADLWHDRPPYPNGLLANYKTTGLAENESKVFLGEKGRMTRCLGRFKRDLKNSVWVLHIINIRETDWEEIRWTKAIASHGQVKTEKGWMSADCE